MESVTFALRAAYTHRKRAASNIGNCAWPPLARDVAFCYSTVRDDADFKIYSPFLFSFEKKLFEKPVSVTSVETVTPAFKRVKKPTLSARDMLDFESSSSVAFFFGIRFLKG